MISKQILIDTPLLLKQQAKSGSILKPDYGICNNWKEVLNDMFSYKLIEQLSIGWEYRTTSYSYPVPDDEDYGLWEGVNLEMRIALIDYILKRLEEYSQEYIDLLYYNLQEIKLCGNLDSMHLQVVD